MPKLTKEEVIRKQMLAHYRNLVVDEKILADYNKATYDKMYYFIEGTKLMPEYARLVKEQQDLREAQQQQADVILEQALTPTPEVSPESEPGSLEIGDAEVTGS